MEVRHQEIKQNIDDLQIVDKQIINTLEVKLLDIKNALDKDEKQLIVLKDLFNDYCKKQETQIKYLKIALGLSVLLTTILKAI
jgi:hypothetical protein